MQRTILFSLPASWVMAHHLDAGEWRSRWVAAGVGDLPTWNSVRVVAVRELLWIVSGSPDANCWLEGQLDAIAGVVAETIADAIPVQVRERAVGVRTGADALWAYRIPRLVIAKGGGDWQPHFKPALDPAITVKMARSIETGLRRELHAWGRLPSMLDDERPFVVVTQAGRPAIIPVIQGNRSGHGKPVNALVRSNVVVLSPLRIEGDLFVGALASLGFGRVLRTPPPEMLDRATQTALFDLPDYHEACA